MHAHAGTFADGVEAWDDGGWIIALRHHDLAVEISRDSTHLIMNGRHNRNGIFNRVDVGKFDRNLANTRQPLHDRLGPEVIKLQQHIIAIRTTSAPFLNLLIH